MKKIFLFALFYVPSCLVSIDAYSQKITDEKIKTIWHKTPPIVFQPTYNSYQIEYDFGNMIAPMGEQPELQGLALKKAEADLILRIELKNIYVIDKKLKTYTKKDGSTKSYYIVSYNASHGYYVIDPKTSTPLYKYKKEKGSFTTAEYSSLSDLNMYMTNGFVSEITSVLLPKIYNRIRYDLSAKDYEVKLIISSIDEVSDAYNEINKATNDFKQLIINKDIDTIKIKSITEIWEKYLAKADLEDNKNEVNSKVADALIENLCNAYLLIQNYIELQKKSDLFYSYHSKGEVINIGQHIKFFVDPAYPGPSLTWVNGKKEDTVTYYWEVDYREFIADILK